MSAAADDDTSIIFKILTAGEWALFQESGVFAGNPLDIADGYIHMSYRPQVPKTVLKFFAGQDNLKLVHVNSTLLVSILRPEANRTGGDVYPHIYGTIPLDAVVLTENLE